MPTGKTPGRGAAREPRRFDQTYLSEIKHGKLVHRDYAAHFFRWGFAWRLGSGKRVLDVGCGPEWPLGRVLQRHGSMSRRASKYVGVDLSQDFSEVHVKCYDLYPGFDFTDARNRDVLKERHGSFDLVCSFEVIEHMDIGDGRMLVMGMAELLEPEGTILISTPRNPGDRKQARNHVHEWSDEELGAVFHEAGLRVRERYGTFGDVDSLRRAAKADPAALQVYDRLRPYYSDEVLACFLAPLYPEACKNSIWVLEHKE